MSEFGKIALLIDGDNARPAYLARIIKTLSGMGELTIRKVFANWNKLSPVKWNSHLLIHHAIPVHVPSYKRGKNATDIALVIDAVKIAYAREADSICIVSSDSDFTDLILFLHTQKIKVIIVGRQNAALPLVKSCDIFIDESTLPETEKLSVRVNSEPEIEFIVPLKRVKRKAPQKQQMKIVGKIDVDKFKKKKKPLKPLTQEFINEAFEMAADEMGVATQKRFSKAFTVLHPQFQINQYGFNTFKEFLDSLIDRFEITTDVKNGTFIKRKE